MKTLKIKTSELDGHALDWATTVSLNAQDALEKAFPFLNVGDSISDLVLRGKIKPSTDWAQCGPLIQSIKVNIYQYSDGEITADIEGHNRILYGCTPLIAVCRAIVAAKLGDSVDVPAELIKPKS